MAVCGGSGPSLPPHHLAGAAIATSAITSVSLGSLEKLLWLQRRNQVTASVHVPGMQVAAGDDQHWGYSAECSAGRQAHSQSKLAFLPGPLPLRMVPGDQDTWGVCVWRQQVNQDDRRQLGGGRRSGFAEPNEMPRRENVQHFMLLWQNRILGLVCWAVLVHGSQFISNSEDV